MQSTLPKHIGENNQSNEENNITCVLNACTYKLHRPNSGNGKNYHKNIHSRRGIHSTGLES
jgi:hypothetical protein